jgi:hypothetical protein
LLLRKFRVFTKGCKGLAFLMVFLFKKKTFFLSLILFRVQGFGFWILAAGVLEVKGISPPLHVNKKMITFPRVFGFTGGLQFEGFPIPSSRLGSSFSRCAPAATHPKVYTEYHAVHAAICRGHHIGSLQELPHTVNDVVVPFPVAFHDPR